MDELKVVKNTVRLSEACIADLRKWVIDERFRSFAFYDPDVIVDENGCIFIEPEIGPIADYFWDPDLLMVLCDHFVEGEVEFCYELENGDKEYWGYKFTHGICDRLECRSMKAES